MITVHDEYKYSEFFSPECIRFGINSFRTLETDILQNEYKRIYLISDEGVKKAGIVKKIEEVIKKTDADFNVSADLIGEPSQDDVLKNLELASKYNAELIIGVGGGASLDVAKTTAALVGKDNPDEILNGTQLINERKVACILIPTTSGTGAEVTKNAIFEDENEKLKKGIVSKALLPDIAIIDPLLTISCPPKVTASSGVDALTHALESYISVNSNLHTKLYAEKAISLFGDSIHTAVHKGNNLQARTDMAWVSLLAGVSLANAGVGAVHALAYPLGGRYHIEHGVANALLLPYVLKVIGTTCESEIIHIAKVLKIGNYENTRNEVVGAVSDYLLQLLKNLNLPLTLKELGVEKEDIPEITKQAVNVRRLMDNTPFQLNEKQVQSIFEDAYEGEK